MIGAFDGVAKGANVGLDETGGSVIGAFDGVEEGASVGNDDEGEEVGAWNMKGREPEDVNIA